MDSIEANLFFDQEALELSEADSLLAFALQSASPACSVRDLDSDFRCTLAEMYRQHPFVITSGYRSLAWERDRGRSGRSSHCKGIAVDIACPSNLERMTLLRLALNFGFTRIGIGKNFIHLDLDDTKPQDRVWTYDDKNNERKG